MKIAVIGGAGFIGSHVAERYIKEGHEVHIIDSLNSGFEKNIPENAKFIELDIINPDILQIFQEQRYDIINYHAYSDGSIHNTDPIADINNSLTGLINVLESLKNSSIKKFIFISNSGVAYGDCCDGPANENTLFDVKSPIDGLKLVAESYVRDYYKKYSCEYTILRYSNVYGPKQFLDCNKGVIGQFIKGILNKKTPVIFGDGEQTRDFIYVKDVARANLLALTSGANQTFNIASQVEVSINKIYKYLSELMDFNCEASIAADDFNEEVTRNIMNNEKAKNVLGFYPDYSLMDGLTETINYYKNESNIDKKEIESEKISVTTNGTTN